MSETRKIFAKYTGTREDFETTQYPVNYEDAIVFINDDSDENGNCIYTHGDYYGYTKDLKNNIDSSIQNLKNQLDTNINEVNVSIKTLITQDSSITNRLLSLQKSLGLATIAEVNALFDVYIMDPSTSN